MHYCALESRDVEGAIRLAISLGGDADTMACIAGSIAEAFQGGIPDPIAAEARSQLTPDLFDVVHRFQSRYGRA